MGVYIELPKEWAKWSFDVRDVHDNVLDANVTDLDLVTCGECIHFHYDKPYIIQGIPVLGHEVCDFWGDGCKTNLNGFCSHGERREDL